MLQLLHQPSGPSETAAAVTIVQEVVESLILDEVKDVSRRVMLLEGHLPIIDSSGRYRKILANQSAWLFSPR